MALVFVVGEYLVRRRLNRCVLPFCGGAEGDMTKLSLVSGEWDITYRKREYWSLCCNNGTISLSSVSLDAYGIEPNKSPTLECCRFARGDVNRRPSLPKYQRVRAYAIGGVAITSESW
jgi:hypothetical protein